MSSSVPELEVSRRSSESNKARNASKEMLKEYRWTMNKWRDGELKLLVKEQESAVAAFRLERLIGQCQSQVEKLKNDESSIMSTYGLSNKQLRRVRKLLEPSRSWLNQ